jgi:hypothetical protein
MIKWIEPRRREERKEERKDLFLHLPEVAPAGEETSFPWRTWRLGGSIFFQVEQR